MAVIQYIFPASYFSATRSKTWANKLSFLAIFILPVFIACYFYTLQEKLNAINFLFAFLAQISLYEVFYLQNDVYTTRHERFPNIRLNAQDHQIVCRHAKLLILSRLFYCALFFALLILHAQPQISHFAVSLICISLFFTLHNKIRSRANIITYGLLCTAKYTALPALFVPLRALPGVTAALFFAFVLLRTFEHAQKAKYHFKRLQNINIDLCRVYYYSLLSLVSIALWLFNQHFSLLAILSLWFFAYRSILYAMLLLKPKIRRKYRKTI